MGKYVIGVDFGSDSVRAIIVNASTGEELGDCVHPYTRWGEGRYCIPAQNQFRQHPEDYLEGVEKSIKGAIASSDGVDSSQIMGIGIDTTGSTIVPVNKEGVPLSLLHDFEENPNAMFILWKDHTAIKEAKEINDIAKSWGGEDYTKYEGGIYSSEWFWAKALHASREDSNVREAAFSWVEHCDWITGVLTGNSDPLSMKRSRCAAGHKAMWHKDWGGLPPKDFFEAIDPILADLSKRLYKDTFTSDVKVGELTRDWAEKLGLNQGVAVAVGAFDCHMGAVGAGIKPHILTKVVGTSTCDILVAPSEEAIGKLIKGICGQVDGSVLPGMEGMEAGQSAFGDIYAWFKRLLMWPTEKIMMESDLLSENLKASLKEEISDNIMLKLEEEALKLPIGETGIVALDWMNGRRTPDANQLLKGAISGLNLGSDAPMIYRALVEATAFGSKKIADRFENEGIRIDDVIAIGGISKKSKFVMQTLADVLGHKIKVCKSEQACALGAAMFGAVVAEIHPDIKSAVEAMSSGFDMEYTPIAENVDEYTKLYNNYSKFGDYIEKETN